MSDKSPSQQIDDIINQHPDWKGDAIKRLRTIINSADSSITEEVKWKTASRPEGLPVWTQNGILCFIEIWKDNIKLLFFKGAQLSDPSKLFNSRLNSSSLRAIELHDGDPINEAGVQALVFEALELNTRS